MKSISPFFTVNILGCCVSRDIFALHENEGFIKVHKFQAQISPVSLFTPPLSERNRDFKDGANFANRMNNLDLTKSWREYFNEFKADWLILDLADSQYPLIKHGSSFLTNNQHLQAVKNELFEADVIEESDPLIKCTDLPIELYKEAINKIFSFFKKDYDKRIIFIKLYNAEVYITRANQLLKYNDKSLTDKNHFFLELYDYIDKNIKLDYTLSCPHLAIASQSNRWGLHPLHYVREYYDIFYEQIKCIISPHNDALTKRHHIALLQRQFEEVNKYYLQLCLPAANGNGAGLTDITPGFANIAPLGKACQSSISQWSQGPDEANCALTGKLMEGWDHSFHTNFEKLAWWMVDLQDYYKIRMVKLFNRDQFRERYTAERLEILFSQDGKNWVDFGHPQNVENGAAYVLKLPGLLFRFVKVQVHDQALHFKRVGVYI